MRIVIMVAMEEEAQYLRPLLGEVRTIDMPGVYGDKATRGRIGDAEVFPRPHRIAPCSVACRCFPADARTRVSTLRRRSTLSSPE